GVSGIRGPADGRLVRCRSLEAGTRRVGQAARRLARPPLARRAAQRLERERGVGSDRELVALGEEALAVLRAAAERQAHARGGESRNAEAEASVRARLRTGDPHREARSAVEREDELALV